MVVKNYKELCGLLGIEIKDGSSKRAQLKDLETLVLFHKSGIKFSIDEIYKIQKIRKDLRLGYKRNYEKYGLRTLNFEEIGVYKIQKDNNIYIGSTVVGFRKRFVEHLRNYNNYCVKTQALLLNGGTFEIVFNATENNVQDEELIRMLEDETIKLYRNNTNFNILNSYETVAYNKHVEKYKTIKFKESDIQKVLELLNTSDISYSMRGGDV